MTNFLHIDSIGQKNAIGGLEDNLKDFLDWSFLNIGGFINIGSAVSGLYGGSFNSLKPVPDPSQKSKIWEAPRKDWVHESGIVFDSQAPIPISGVYLNGTFLPSPTGSGSYTYQINYPLGTVSFDNNVSSNSTVNVNYSYRYVQVYKANESMWWKELQKETYNPANYSSTGDISITANHRLQLPTIIIETIPRSVQIPHELGNTNNIIIQDVLLHIFTQNINQRNNLAETLLVQKDKTLSLYNVNKVAKDSVYGILKDGSKNPIGLNYPTLCSNYHQHWCTIKNSILVEFNTLSASLFNGIVRWSVEIFP